MSTPNPVNLNNLDIRYSKPADVAAAISAQATTDAGQYATKALTGTDVASDKQEPFFNSSSGKVIFQDPTTFYAARYGAKFDNVTDDTAALLACHAAASAYARTSGASRVVYPAGTAYLATASQGGLPLPYNSPGIVFEGQGERVTGFRLSKECPRLFDMVGGNAYTNITLRRFFVDAGNVGRYDVGSPQVVSSSATLTSYASTVVTVPSTSGWASKGRCYFPTSNSGTSAGKAMQFTVQSATTISVANYTGISLTISSGDTIQGAIDDHVIVGTRRSGNDAGLAADGVSVTDLTVEDVRTINVPSVQGVSIGAPATGHTRWNICLAPTTSGTPSSLPQLVRINIRRVSMSGGEIGIFIGSFGSAPQVWSAFLDHVYIEDCSHNTNLIPAANFFSLNYEIGGCAYGYRAAIRRCHGYGSGDVGVEINSIMDATVEDCVMEEFGGGGYYHVNYGIPTSSSTGPATTTLSASIASGDTSATVAALPTGQPTTGYIVIDSEVLQYTATSSTAVTLSRGFNGSTAAAHNSGSSVIFIEIHRQSIKYIRCTARLRVAAPPAGTWMPKGFYSLLPPSKYPHGRIRIRDCEVDNGMTYLGSRFGGAEAFYMIGWVPEIDINGLEVERHGINYSGTDSRRASLISFDTPTATTGPQTRLKLDRIVLRYSGSLQSSTGYPVVSGIAFESGFYVLDWGSIEVDLTGIRNPAPGATTGIDFTAVSGASRVRGSIRRLRVATPSADGAPTAITIPSSGFALDGLDIIDLDLTDFNFSSNTGNSNYRPLNVGSSFAPNVSVRNWRHPTGINYAYNNFQHRHRVVTTGSYGGAKTDEYVGCQLSAAQTVYLPLANATSTFAVPNPSIGREIIVKDENGTAASNTITIKATGSETIDGSTTGVTITTAYGSKRFMSIGSGWITI